MDYILFQQPMTHLTQAHQVPYTPEQMFELVHDVAAYPDFLPWCRHCDILEQSDQHMRASLAVSWGGISQSITTENHGFYPHRLDMHLIDGPFETFQGRWTFESCAEGTLVTLDIDFEWKNRLWALTLEQVFKQVTDKLVHAFVQRAHHQYESPHAER